MTYGRRGPATNVYRAPPTDPCFETSAFHWANLTSGSRITALWILLTPYALANLAGWMAGWQPNPTVQTGPGDHQSWHRRLGCLSIRSAGLALTALFVAQSLTAGVLLPMRWLSQNETLMVGPLEIGVSIPPRAALTVLVISVGLLFLWLVAVVSTRTHFPRVERESPLRLLFDVDGATMIHAREGSGVPAANPREDPGGALVTDGRMWTVHTMLHRLRRLHFSGGLIVLSLGVLSWTSQIQVAAGLLILLPVFALFGWLVTYLPESGAGWWLGVLAPHASVILFVGAISSIWASDPANWQPEISHTLSFGIAVVLAVFAFGALAAGPLSLGALVLATFSGVVLGTSVGLLIDGALGTNELIGEGVGWVAIAMLALIGWLLVVALAAAFIGHEEDEAGGTSPLPTSSKLRWLVLFRRVLLEARLLFYGAGLFGIAATVYVAAAIWRFGVEAGARGLVETLEAGLDPAALGTFSGLLVQVAVTITIVVPGYFAIRSIRKGWISEEGGRGRRRQVGILWDLGSFWPRWYHPLAPPGYGPRAVEDLGEVLDGLPDGSLIGAHSQGSLIAAVTLSSSSRPLGLITYGSQLGILYPRMFPATGIPELVDLVSGRVTNWINLWRRTDPIGGQYLDHPEVNNRHVDDDSGHSRYEPTPTYSLTRREMAGIGEGPC